MAMSLPSYEKIMQHARNGADLKTLAFAGVISEALAAGRRPLIRGLSEALFQQMLAKYFPGLVLLSDAVGGDHARIDEFDDLLQLLLDCRLEPDEELAWLSCAIASAAMADNHLWQDMGLPNRKVLSALMAQYFPVLSARNIDDMKWKKFFYRQLCERAEIPICKSPSCAICTDYDVCFAAEEGDAKVPSIRVVPVQALS
jgi:nitrogen fixation protein NifQ